MTHSANPRWHVASRAGVVDQPLAASTAHAQIRSRILSGALAGGAIISQVELAAELGISRTPLREALRMLQEEGLVESEPNRRCRVTGFDAVDLDATYGTRLMLEALGMRLTLHALRPAAIERGASLLDELDVLGGPQAGDIWHHTHHEFHQTFVSGAPRPLLDQINSHAQRSERYIAHVATAPTFDGTARAVEHRQILEHVRAGQHDDAMIAKARHMARTPLMLLAQVAAELEPTSIRAALSMIVALKPSHPPETSIRRRATSTLT